MAILNVVLNPNCLKEFHRTTSTPTREMHNARNKNLEGYLLICNLDCSHAFIDFNCLVQFNSNKIGVVSIYF